MIIERTGSRIFPFGSARQGSTVTGDPEAAWTEPAISDIRWSWSLSNDSHSDVSHSDVVLPTHLRDAQNSVSDLAGREHNWDGQGAAEISSLTGQFANRTLWELAQLAGENERVLPTPSIGVTPDGAIGFEWSSPSAYVAVECLGDRRSAYIRADGTESERRVRSGRELWNRIESALALVETAEATA